MKNFFKLTYITLALSALTLSAYVKHYNNEFALATKMTMK